MVMAMVSGLHAVASSVLALELFIQTGPSCPRSSEPCQSQPWRPEAVALSPEPAMCTRAPQVNSFLRSDREFCDEVTAGRCQESGSTALVALVAGVS